jgi:hypothetical protein
MIQIQKGSFQNQKERLLEHSICNEEVLGVWEYERDYSYGVRYRIFAHISIC